MAENSGGVQEKTVKLTFDDPSEYMNRPLSPDQWTVVIGAITASLVFLALLIGLICFCCVCKNQSKNAKHGMNNHNRSVNIWIISTNRIKITVVEFQAAQLAQSLVFWALLIGLICF